MEAPVKDSVTLCPLCCFQHVVPDVKNVHHPQHVIYVTLDTPGLDHRVQVIIDTIGGL